MTTTQSGLDSTRSAAYPRWMGTLGDRNHVVIRPITPLDKEAERAFIEGLSPMSRHLRFLGEVRHPSDRLLDQLTRIDAAHDAAFAAVTRENAHERIVGVSRFSAGPREDSCECAVTVADDWQGKGLGTLLMKYLIDVARARGFHRMYSIDSAENVRMTSLADDLGFRTRGDPDDASQVIHELTL
jgi:GNAT superfamily N-acetyltransferase